jgi:hypothetical protein
MGTVIIFLAFGTARGDLGWERVVVDDITGESMGRCKSDLTQQWYIHLFVILHLIPIVLAGVMAYRYVHVRWKIDSGIRFLLTFLTFLLLSFK